MNEQLPIRIGCADALTCQLPALTAMSNKLEAQFNFQTLTAGWYGDEENILNIHLSLVTSGEFARLQQEEQPGECYDFADDVRSYHHRELHQILCIIALTDKELTLVSSRRELLTVYLQTKLHKVLNLIATQEKLLLI